MIAGDFRVLGPFSLFLRISAVAGELGLFCVLGIGEARPAFEGDLAALFVESDDAVTVGALAFVVDVGRVGIGHHREFVAQAATPHDETHRSVDGSTWQGLERTVRADLGRCLSPIVVTHVKLRCMESAMC